MSQINSKVPIPQHVTIVDKVFTIEDWNRQKAAAENKYGEYSPHEEIIRVDFSQLPQQHRNTLLHELIHCMFDQYELKGDDSEERIVAVLGNAITAMMVQNPHIREYLNQEWSKSYEPTSSKNTTTNCPQPTADARRK